MCLNEELHSLIALAVKANERSEPQSGRAAMKFRCIRPCLKFHQSAASDKFCSALRYIFRRIAHISRVTRDKICLVQNKICQLSHNHGNLNTLLDAK